ncbi:MAG: asparagine synthase C-terminal domain-containing protein, partial [Methanothrix sp.]|nr:asparagine synthase C-terminal domain-containing protein [Methanothrix sp.]
YKRQVPVGTCLSGGIDSSAIACLINDTKRAEIKTFSAVFPGFSQDEAKYIDLVAEKTGMSNFKVKPTASSLVQDLEGFISRIGEPVPSPSPYSQYCVQRLAKENDVTVLLDGQGSDELFAGYHYFYGFYFKHLLRGLRIGTFLRELAALIRGGQFRIGVLSVLFLMTPLFVRSYYFEHKSNISEELLHDNEARTGFFESYYTCGSLHEALEFHMRYKLEHLLKWEDRNSMAHSREARVPFLDYRIVEFVSGLPERFIIHSGMTKAILRDAMRGTVPEEILDRRDKIGFAAPEDDWLRSGEMRELLEEWFIRERPISAPFIDLERTRRMIHEHLARRRGHGRALWRTLFLEAWMRVFFDGALWRCPGD